MEANYIVKYSYKVYDFNAPEGYTWDTVQMPFNNLEDARLYKAYIQDHLKTKAFLLCNSETTRSGLN